MLFGDGQLIDAARELRQNSTPAEEIFWEAVRNRKFIGLKFRRQQAIKFYVVDFYCDKHKLIVELDGTVHDSEEAQFLDQDRSFNLSKWGYKIIRFKNADIFNRLSECLDEIAAFIKPTPSLIDTSLRMRGMLVYLPVPHANLSPHYSYLLVAR